MKLKDLHNLVPVEVIAGQYKGIKGRITGETDTMYQVVADNPSRVSYVKQGEYVFVNKNDVIELDEAE